MGEGLKRAFAAAKAARSPPASEEHLKFLRELARWSGVASPQELVCQTSQAQNAARQTCKRRGWVTFSNGYWRLTDAGRAILRT